MKDKFQRWEALAIYSSLKKCDAPQIVLDEIMRKVQLHMVSTGRGRPKKGDGLDVDTQRARAIVLFREQFPNETDADHIDWGRFLADIEKKSADGVREYHDLSDTYSQSDIDRIRSGKGLKRLFPNDGDLRSSVSRGLKKLGKPKKT